MSCADVMYQHYTPYFSVYQRSQVPSAASVSALTPSQVQTGVDYRKCCSSKSSDLDSANSSSSECRLRSTSSRGGETASCRDKDKADAQYLSANCVVFTYYSGDISAVIDEHFTRALSQASGYTAPVTETTSTKSTKDGPPMSHRNFPPSFWNSNYQPTPNSSLSSGLGPITGHADLSYPGDPYHHSTAALHASLHHQNRDPWHYSLSSQAGHFGHHRPHDLSSYHPGMPNVPGTSGFSSQYGSLLLQPSVRSAARLGSAAAAAACAGLDKASDTWGTARYHDPIGHMDSNYASTYGGMAMTGLESPAQESKDLYWF